MKQSYSFFSKFAIFLFLISLAKPSLAQENIVTYIKKNGSITPFKDSADYTRIISLSPNAVSLYELNEYYRNNNLKRHGWVKAPDQNRLRFEGLVETYYDNENLEAVLNYADNKLIDTAKRYYRNGILKESVIYLKLKDNQNYILDSDLDTRLVYYADSLNNVQIKNGNGTAKFVDKDKDVEQGDYAEGVRVGRWRGTMLKSKYQFEEWYEQGKMVNGETTDSLGQKIKYTKKQIQPEYPGGINELRAFIGKNYKYPKESISAMVVGTVLINFVVEKDGKTTNHKIINDLGYGTGDAGVEAIKKSQNWSPGYQRGIPVRVAYSLPIRLNPAK